MRRFSGDHCRCGAIAKEDRRNQIGLRDVLALERERSQLDGDDQHVPAGFGLQVIGRTRQPHGARGAAQFRERHAADIRTESHQVNKVGVQRRNHEARAGDGDDQVDLIGPQARALQAFFRGFPSELHRMLDVFVVGLRQRAGFDRVVERKDGMPLVDLGVIHDAHHYEFAAAV